MQKIWGQMKSFSPETIIDAALSQVIPVSEILPISPPMEDETPSLSTSERSDMKITIFLYVEIGEESTKID